MRIILEIFIRRSVPLKANAEGGCVAGTSSGIGAKRSGTRFTKYLTTMLRSFYDNAKVTINLQQASNLQNSLQ